MPAVARRFKKQQQTGLSLLDIFGLNSAQSITDPGQPIRLDYKIVPHSAPPLDRIWVPYEPIVQVTGAQRHPAPIMQTRSLYAMMPDIPTDIDAYTYENMLTSGAISDVQYEAVIMVEARHQQFHTLADGRQIRTGWGGFLGTGTGKTRASLAAYINNKIAGREVAIIMTANEMLIDGYLAEMSRLAMDTDKCFIVKGHFEDDIQNIDLAKTPILFLTYKSASLDLWCCSPDFLESVRTACTHEIEGEKVINEVEVRKAIPRKTIAQALAERLGEDFDGLVIADEADEVGGARALGATSRGQYLSARERHHTSDQGRAFAILDEMLPMARFVVASASGIPRIGRMPYCADRLNFVGSGTPFQTARDIQHELMDATYGAMEGFLMDAYTRGLLHSVAVSFEGCTYTVYETHLSEAEFLAINEYIAIFAQILSHVERFTTQMLDKIRDIELQYAKDPAGFGVAEEDRQAATEAFKSLNATLRGRQNYAKTWLFERWLRHLLLNIKEESLGKVVAQKLAEDKSVIIQIADTGAAETNRQIDLGVGDGELCTSHKAYLKMIANATITPYEETIVWDSKKKRWKLQQTVDLWGQPILDEAGKQVLDDIHEAIDVIVDDHDALYYLYTHFGDQIAEVSNRTHIVYKKDGGVIKERRTPGSANRKAIRDFADGTKRVLIISRSGYRGIDAHADRKFKNQQKRCHIIYDATDRPELFLQALGRSNRSNQVCQPEYAFLPSNLPFDQAAMSILIHKLSETGALSYGDARATHAGLLSSDFNLLDVWGVRALGREIERIYQHGNPDIPAALWTYYGGSRDDIKLGDHWNQEQRKLAKHAYLTMARLPLDKDGGAQRKFLDSVVREREMLRGERFGHDDASKALPRLHGERVTLVKSKHIGPNTILKTFKIEQPKGIYSSFAMARDYYERLKEHCTLLLSPTGVPMVCRQFDDGSVFVIMPENRQRAASMPLGTPLDIDKAEVLWTEQYETLERWSTERQIVCGNVTAAADMFRDEKSKRKRIGLYTGFVEVVASDGTHHFGKLKTL